MARDGSGDYSRVEGPYVNGDVADANQINTELDDISTALSDSINRAGSKAFAGDQDMGGFKLTNLAAPASSNDAARKAYVDSAITGLSSSYQPLDATLTALAALSWSSGSALVQFTAADTVSLTLAPSVTSITVSQGGSPSTPTLNFASATNYGLYYVTGDVGFAANGGVTASYNTARWQWFVPCRGPDGSASAPTWAYNNDTDCGWYRIGTNNLGFALNGTKYGDFSTTIFDLLVPTRARAPRSAETSGTLTAASANKVVVTSAGVTINDGVFTADDVIVIYNDSASGVTITQDTGMTLRFAGSTSTGNRTLAARGVCTIYVLSSTEAIISGNIT